MVLEERMGVGVAIEWIMTTDGIPEENIQFKIGFGTSMQYIKILSLYADLIGNDNA